MAASCARRAAFTHHEKLTREPALAPAPGTALRSRESRASRICAVDPEIGSVTQSESRPPLMATWCRLERSYRAEGALSMRAPEDNQDIVEIGLSLPARRSLWHAARWTDRVHPSRVAHERASDRPSTREHPAEFSVESQQDLCTRSGDRWSDAQLLSPTSCAGVGVPPGASLSRRRRTFDESPGGRSWDQAVRAGDRFTMARGALDGAVSLIARRLRARYRLSLHPGSTLRRSRARPRRRRRPRY